MEFLSLLIWVTQFGFSAVFPICFFLALGSWLRMRFDLGAWVMLVCALVGALTAARTVRSCLRAMRADAEKLGNQNARPNSKNDHM